MEQQPMTFNDWHAGFQPLYAAYKLAEQRRHVCALNYADLCLDLSASPSVRDFAANEYANSAKAYKAAQEALSAYPAYSDEC